MIEKQNFNILNINDVEQVFKLKQKQITNIYVNDDEYDSLKRASPFHKYYKDLIFNFKIYQSSDSNLLNSYYKQELFNIIFNYIHLMPLWSAVIIKKTQKNLLERNLISKESDFLKKTRLSNNPVENHFGFTKNRILQKRKKLFPSELTGPQYRSILSKSFEFYSELDKNLPNTLVVNKKQKISEEKWKDKSLIKREKSYYYKKLIQFGFRISHSR
jgi:hypothetical protein